jgi:hypothetical protein
MEVLQLYRGDLISSVDIVLNKVLGPAIARPL